MKKIVFIIFTFLVAAISIPILNEDNDKLNAASNYSTGSKVFIGNDSYTVIDPTTMTLLKDSATDAGIVTWNNAIISLLSLANNYGELGSKAVSNNFTLPKTSDLTNIMNSDNTALVNIEPIATDWWLGDASIDNRSKFVGANTNSLVTEVERIKNVLDEEAKVCNTNQTVVEQGIKPTKTSNDPTKTIEKGLITYQFEYDGDFSSGSKGYKFFNSTDCTGGSSNVFSKGSGVITTDGNGNPKFALNPAHYAIYLGVITNSGLKSYFKENASNSVLIKSKVVDVTLPSANTCHVIKSDESLNNYRTYQIYGMKNLKITITSAKASDLSCPGYAQTAGTSSVRPLLTLDKSKLAYSSVTKPSFQSNSSVNQSVPEIDGNYSYLTLKDSDLGIMLDSSNSNVSGNTLMIDRSNTTVSIPVTLSGITSGTRYVSVVGTTNNGDRYSVLGQVNGTTGTVQLDLTSLANYQTAKTLNLTLYQEVDEGTNTTYRGNGTQITLEFNSAPITAITFTPDYPSGNTSWTEGDAGIDTAGAKTGTFTFTGGTSGVNDPTSGKDYKKWEIVDASGNPTTDANFDIVNNELKAKKRISAGTYTLKVKVTDNGDETFTDTITITVVGHPTPILEYNPTGSTLTYGDNPTKVNNTIGTFTLTYPAGEPTSNIKTIQLGNSGDEAHFSVDTTGALKVKGTNLDAGTYSVTVSGTDGNDMPFTKTVSITVNKKNQDNYQITNNANYPFQLNQEINITTTGNDSGESETYTITNGNSVAQISGTKFKLLSSGTFTLELLLRATQTTTVKQ